MWFAACSVNLMPVPLVRYMSSHTMSYATDTITSDLPLTMTPGSWQHIAMSAGAAPDWDAAHDAIDALDAADARLRLEFALDLNPDSFASVDEYLSVCKAQLRGDLLDVAQAMRDDRTGMMWRMTVDGFDVYLVEAPGEAPSRSSLYSKLARLRLARIIDHAGAVSLPEAPSGMPVALGGR